MSLRDAVDQTTTWVDIQHSKQWWFEAPGVPVYVQA